MLSCAFSTARFVRRKAVPRLKRETCRGGETETSTINAGSSPPWRGRPHADLLEYVRQFPALRGRWMELGLRCERSKMAASSKMAARQGKRRRISNGVSVSRKQLPAKRETRAQ